jgi:hypothetical protein
VWRARPSTSPRAPRKARRRSSFSLTRWATAHIVASYALGAILCVLALFVGGLDAAFGTIIALLAPLAMPVLCVLFILNFNGDAISWRVALIAGAIYWPVFIVVAIRARHASLPPEERYPPGRCRNCGYDLRESPIRCPECGTFPFRTSEFVTAEQAAEGLRQLVDGCLVDEEGRLYEERAKSTLQHFTPGE